MPGSGRSDLVADLVPDIGLALPDCPGNDISAEEGAYSNGVVGGSEPASSGVCGC